MNKWPNRPTQHKYDEKVSKHNRKPRGKIVSYIISNKKMHSYNTLYIPCPNTSYTCVNPVCFLATDLLFPYIFTL